MADLSCNFAGIRSPNPFWLASGPPTNTAHQVCRAFEVGWGGAVWKTLTDEPIVNVASRYGGVALNNQKLMGLNNIELVSDRPLEDNLREIAEVKKRFPKHALIASVMVESTCQAWHRIVKRIQDTGIDGFELNFGCPHGMSERGMGSAVGQVPEYAERICAWVKEVATVPVLAKLTPNVTSIREIGRAVKRGGADGISLINTINSIMGVDVKTFAPKPSVGGFGSHGGYCGPAVKPIALNMVSEIARDEKIGLPVSGIGGIRKWDDCVEFILLGATTLQVCTAVMHRGFGVVKAMTRGLEKWMDETGLATIDSAVGKALPRIKQWGDLDLNYKVVAKINEATCIHCGICYASCEDGCYQAIAWDRLSAADYTRKFGEPKRFKGEAAPNLQLNEDGRAIDVFTIRQDACVGCNMCALACPVEGCITMEEVPTGNAPMSWNQYQAMLKTGQVEKIAPKKVAKV
ncbi:MAG: NAD-dependent dihydropyrimidine dehydrogenase subunit PreA [Tepidisphaeraceae bacterium]